MNRIEIPKEFDIKMAVFPDMSSGVVDLFNGGMPLNIDRWSYWAFHWGK